jgi:hypothetical protein
MKSKMPFFLIILFFLGINTAVSQAIDLGSVKNFSLYTSDGAVTNTGQSVVTGDIGSNEGAIAGFEAPTIVNGTIYNVDSITEQAALDLIAAVDQINNTTTTNPPLGTPFGNGTTMTPGVYAIGAAAAIHGTLTLDAQGDPNAQFIFKIGGLFTTQLGAEVILTDCASSANIFWLAEGASFEDETIISGNIITNEGAITMKQTGKLTGRFLSTKGAISINTSMINSGVPTVGPITQPTCTIATGSFQITDYDSENTYVFTPTVLNISEHGVVTADPNTYTFTVSNGAGCIISDSSEDVVINPGPTTNSWTGANSSDWNNANNWTCGVPNDNDLSHLINIIPIATTYPIIGAEPDSGGLAKNIEIKSGASVTINNNYLQITSILTLNGKIYLEGESQLLQDSESDLDPASTGSIEIDQQGTGNSFRYNYWSSPVNSSASGTTFTLGEVLKDGTDLNNFKDIDFGSPNTYADGVPSSPIKLSTRWMYKLEDSGSGYSAWAHVGNTGEVKVGQGYTIKGSNTGAAEQNYTFVGKPNNGIIELAVAANNSHLVGNPYPSAIDANQFIEDNKLSSITGTLYFWEHYGGDTHVLSGYQAGYGTYTQSGGVSASSAPPATGVSTLGSSVKGAPERYIPIGQAFFVVGDEDGGQIQFNNSQRVFKKESDVNSIFMKPHNSESKVANNSGDDLRPKFRIGFDAPKINHRQILLTLDKNTTDAVDWGYDAKMYQFFDDDMYWVLNDKKYVIQATNKFGIDKEIPIGIQTKNGGLIRIKIDALENADEYTSIYIKDNLTGETHDITHQYFEINLEAGEYQNRFLLVFQPRLKTIEEVTLFDGVHIYMNNSISELQLNKIVDTEILNVSLFNYLGQQLKTWSINTDERLISLPIKITPGVYIVKVVTTTGKLNKKIIIN